MADTKTLWLSPLAIAAAVVVGAGADRLAVTVYETTAKVREIRLLGDGQIAVGITTTIGDCTGDREYVFAADGSNARLNGRPVKDADSAAIGAAARLVADQALKTAALADATPLVVQILGDGQTALTLQRTDKDGLQQAQVVYAADGGAPRVNGVATEDPALLEAGPILAAFRPAADVTAAKLVDTLTKPLAEIPAEPPPKAAEDLGKASADVAAELEQAKP